MSEQIIKTIKINIGGQDCEVTPDELINLHAAIGELLNLKTEKVVEREIVRDRFVPQPYPVIPPYLVPYLRPICYANPNAVGAAGGKILSDTFEITYSGSTESANLMIQ